MVPLCFDVCNSDTVTTEIVFTLTFLGVVVEVIAKTVVVVSNGMLPVETFAQKMSPLLWSSTYNDLRIETVTEFIVHINSTCFTY